MSSLLKITPRESRAAETEVLPDGRKRLTRFLETTTTAKVPEELGFAYGDVDTFANAPSGWAGLRLTGKKLTDELPVKGKDSRPVIVLIYEQIDASAETQVGGKSERVLEDGRIGYDRDSVQFSTGSFTPGVVGTSTDPDDGAAYLQNVDAPDDGTVRRIKRTYVYAGELATSTEFKLNGNLTLISTTWAKTVPTTPNGFTLIGTPTQNPNGLPVYTYTFAKGLGQVSDQIEYRQSPDMGTTGVTITTLKTFSLPSTSTDPNSGPGGSVKIGGTMEEADGYRIWTTIYAAGAGVILNQVDTKNGGKLIIYRITSINAAPSAPAATIGGTVALITNLKHNGSRFDSGILIYEYAWAEGEGQISEDFEYEDSIDQGANGITKTTVRFLVAPGASMQPTSVSGSALAKQAFEDVEGYRIWTTVWGKGAGLAVDESTVNKVGALVLYHRVGFGSAPTPPAPTIGGTLVQIQKSSRNAEGYQIFDYRWAEGNGTSSSITYSESDGAIMSVVTELSNAKVTPSYPGTGGTAYLVKLEQTAEEGYYVNMAVYKLPPATDAVPKQINNFKYPGFIDILSGPSGLRYVPPVDMNILATETTSYSTSPTTTPAFTVKAWATVAINYVPTNQSSPKQTVSQQKAATSYLAGATSDSDTNSVFNGIPCDSWEYQIGSSTPSAPPTGSTILEVQNDLYLVDITGTKVYRSRVVTFTF